MSEFVWKKQESVAGINGQPEKVKKVLVLYTGGTIGMKWDQATGYEPVHNYFEQKIRTYPQLCDPHFKIEQGSSSWRDMPEDLKPIALPPTFQQCRILYAILEYFPLLDSSNLSMEDWARIGKDIETYYQKFNGFVILHGTDTMAYTASALSFMFQDLGKSVVMTGSQVPISELRNDARDNLLGALIMAGQYVIPEVTIYFHNKLYRGNRTTKMNSSNLEPFNTPNLIPLATVGIDISVDWDSIYRPAETEKFKVHSTMNRNVGILRIFPGITAITIRSFLQPPMEGVVLQTFGAGNVPDNDANSYLIEQLKEACQRGVVIVNCTQCTSGNVTLKYAAGIKLKAAGVVPGADMTTEAALTKLSYLLGKGYSREEIKTQMTKNLRGELTVFGVDQQQFTLKDSEFLRTVAQALNLSSSKEVRMLRATLFPPLMCAAAAKGDIDCLETLHLQGGDFNIPDYDGRTPLHLASSEGHLETVKYLLHNGASVHATDRFNHTPLDDAVRFKKLTVIPILVQTGAELNTSTCEIAVQAASDNDTDAAIVAWTLAEPKVRQSPLQSFKRGLDTAASLEANLKQTVRRLSLDFTDEDTSHITTDRRPSVPPSVHLSPPPPFESNGPGIQRTVNNVLNILDEDNTSSSSTGSNS